MDRSSRIPFVRRSNKRSASPVNFRPCVEELEARRLLASMTYDVTSAADDGGANKLRWAIQQHNLNNDPGDKITFHIGTGQQTITLAGQQLDPIAVTVLIDGTTQPGFNPLNPVPLIQINGAGLVGNGLDFDGGSSTVQWIIVSNFGADDIYIDKGTNGISIKNCWVGLDATGNAKAGNSVEGIRIYSSNNTISGCVSSGNGFDGLRIDTIMGSRAAGNIISSCYFGTNWNGTAQIANGNDGILITGQGKRIPRVHALNSV
jgi:hypothetical protein